jgi:carbonic anhydrase/acetyltransferase-like protein (isoleucine patch superfamily)
MNNVRSFQGIEPQIAADAWVDETAVVIGDVRLGHQASVWPMAVIRGDIHRIEIGSGTNIQDGSVLHVSHDSRFLPGGAPLILHDRVTVGHAAVLHGCEIHDSCLIGIGARVLDRAVLKARVMLAAGALVPPGRVLEGGYMYVGTPARRVRPLTDMEQQYLDYVAQHYIELTLQHRATAL